MAPSEGLERTRAGQDKIWARASWLQSPLLARSRVADVSMSEGGEQMGFPALPGSVEAMGKALEKASGFAAKLIDSPLEEIGLILQDHLRSFRFRRQISLFLRAQDRLEAAGIEPSTVPLKTIVPLLEGASLEDDPDLQEHWVGLLASAAASSEGTAVSPTFPKKNTVS